MLLGWTAPGLNIQVNVAGRREYTVAVSVKFRVTGDDNFTRNRTCLEIKRAVEQQRCACTRSGNMRFTQCYGGINYAQRI